MRFPTHQEATLSAGQKLRTKYTLGYDILFEFYNVCGADIILYISVLVKGFNFREIWRYVIFKH